MNVIKKCKEMASINSLNVNSRWLTAAGRPNRALFALVMLAICLETWKHLWQERKKRNGVENREEERQRMHPHRKQGGGGGGGQVGILHEPRCKG